MVYVKDQLGHASIAITVDVYGHAIPNANRGAVERFAEATQQERERRPPAVRNFDETSTVVARAV